MAALEVHQIPVWNDNCVYLSHDEATGSTAVGLTGADTVAVFAEVRGRKDNF